jgi:hypothetical protein
MWLLGIAAFAFGLLAATRFSAAPFIAGNIVAAVAVVVLGLANKWSLSHILAGCLVTITCLQAAFLFGTVRSNARGWRSASDQPAKQALQRDVSTIDRAR